MLTPGQRHNTSAVRCSLYGTAPGPLGGAHARVGVLRGMGIDGLLPCLKSVTRPGHVRAYAGQRVAVDSYVWLHRGVFTCARELALGQPTDKCVARGAQSARSTH